jgi:hypothetical protein
MKISLTPILLLLGIIAVLVISLFMNNTTIEEPFSTYNYGADVHAEFTILTYHETRSVTKLYDNLYFDKSNRNIIEVISVKYDANATSDQSQDTYTDIKIVSNVGGEIVNKNIAMIIDEDSGAVSPNDSPESDFKFKTSADKYYDFETTNVYSKYKVAVFEKDKDTVIHIMDIMDTSKHISTSIFTYGENGTGSVVHKPLNAVAVPIASSETFSNIKEGVENNLPGKTLSLYSDDRILTELISDKMYIDMRNYNIIGQITGDSVSVIKTDGTTVKRTESSDDIIVDDIVIDTVTVNPMYPDQPAIAIYTPTGFYFMLFTSGLALDTAKFIKKKIANVVTDNTSAAPGSGSVGTTDLSQPTTSGEINDNTKSDTDDQMSKIFRRMIADYASDDYMLKTEIVPPVCPTCPSCVGDCNSVCTNCGGNGGSGTQGSNGSSLTTDSETTHTTDKNGNVIIRTVDSAGNAIVKIIDSAGNVTVKTIDTAGKVIDSTVAATGQAISDVRDGVKTVSTDVYDGAGNVISDVGDGVKTVSTDVYDGAGNVISTAGDVAKTVGTDVYDGAGNVLSTAGGAVNAIGKGLSTVTRDLYGGIKGLGVGATSMGQYNQGTGYGPNQGQGPNSRISYENSISNYDYYGALPAKTSDYIARTADFGAFGK